MAEKQKAAANLPGNQQDGAGNVGETPNLLDDTEQVPVEEEEDEEEEEEEEEAREDDPVRRAEREVIRANNRLADAKDKAKRDNEIEKAIEQYRAVQVHLEADQSALAEQQREGLENLAASDTEKADVRAVRAALREEIHDLEESIERRRKALEEDRGALARGQARLAEVKDEYEGLKTQGKGVQDKHRAAEALRKEAFDAIGRKRRLAYYLLEYQLGRTIGRPPHPIEPADFIREIKQASDEYGRLSRRLANLEESIKQRAKELADDEKKLADLRKARDATTRERLSVLA